MLSGMLAAFLVFLVLNVGANGQDPLKPMGVRLSIVTFESYTVTWNTFAQPPNPSSVEWTDEDGKNGSSIAKTTIFDNQNVTRFIHRAQINNIQPGKKYKYQVQSGNLKSKEFTFVGNKEREGGYRYAIFGDLGLSNAVSLPRLINETQHREYDLVIHNGDFAYDLFTMNGTYGDKFLDMIEPIAATVPYLTTPGNHEFYENFTYYVNLFSMPGDASNHWFSFDQGLVHFVLFSTEVYFYYNTHSPELLVKQFKWLEQDLKKANENRKNVPWIVTLGHRPMYCSSKISFFGIMDCQVPNSMIRKGILGVENLGLEKLFYEHGVDLEIWGHVHAYERLWPVYDGMVYNGSEGAYVDPGAPIHITTGSAGNQENADEFKEPGVWDAYRSSEYGYAIMQVPNKTHLHWQQFATQKGVVEDDVWIVKNSHGPYKPVHN